MKYLFLDCDGVLNHSKSPYRLKSGYMGIDPEQVARLNRIIDAHPDVRIVISSTWRKVTTQEEFKDIQGLYAYLHERGVTGTFLGHTKIRFSDRARGAEIREWLEENLPKEGEHQFVILDDDTEEMKPYKPRGSSVPLGRDLRPYHVVTEWDGSRGQGGLQDVHVQQAIDILNGKLLDVPDRLGDESR